MTSSRLLRLAVALVTFNLLSVTVRAQVVDSLKPPGPRPLQTTTFTPVDSEAVPYLPPPKDFPSDQWGNTIPDFSKVGYRNGATPLPIAPVKVTLRPSGNPLQDDRVRIQAAIDKVGNMPLQPFTLRDGTKILLRGAVLLRAGTYRVQGSLILNKDGVILRGEGNGDNGTIVNATGDFIHDFIHLNGLLDPATQGDPNYQRVNATTKCMHPWNIYLTPDEFATAVKNVYVPVGSVKVPVRDVRPFKVGAQVVVERPATTEWIHRLGMDRIVPRPVNHDSMIQWDPDTYTLSFVRQVMEVHADDPKKQTEAEAGLPKSPDGQVRGLRMPRYPNGEKAQSSFKEPPAYFPYPKSSPPQKYEGNSHEMIYDNDGDNDHSVKGGKGDNREMTADDRPWDDWNWSLDDFDDFRFRGQRLSMLDLQSRFGLKKRSGAAPAAKDVERFSVVRHHINATGDYILGPDTPTTTRENNPPTPQPSSSTPQIQDNKLGVPIPGYLVLNIPIVMALDPWYGGGYVYNFEQARRLPSDIGLENMRLVSSYNPQNPEDEQHAWYSVMIDNCQNCWVADVVARHFVSGIKAGFDSVQTTIQDCEVLKPISLRSEGGRRYMFMLHGQMGLVKRCRAMDGRHDFITGAKTSGPNVFVDSEGLNGDNDAGPHERWAVGTLYDNIKSFRINIQNRGSFGTGHGWAGAFHVMYHCAADNPAFFQSPPGATNWIVAFNGTFSQTRGGVFQGDDATYLEPDVKDLFPVNKVPRSLYWAQLVERLGGSRDAKIAMRVEELVGAKSRNQYPTVPTDIP
ncbi:hypothetical protein DFQ27_003352 [Actinomortierella ambigua]|uniref:Uncharacterized protein n=1 Tax=Actinomortierella ambigua TaxID=1343610 RepID=A0A9P6U628_9FUNG|nr:hypothetical protein DFQ27_003352 [Actinomortierella ambigua]